MAGAPALVLIRPDGHIAFRGPVHRPDLLQEFCRAKFGRPATGAEQPDTRHLR
ncbi:hypothetical protein [Muricoccus vinaceus]|uniref:Uncharacterized protein n=1 Tax=Muricoccus vinaceus TaxID=424704 RepID=A0ABV6IRF3_9PROT